MNVVGFPRRVRTLWISDIHLGTRGCRAVDSHVPAHPSVRHLVSRRRHRRLLAAEEVLVLADQPSGGVREFRRRADVGAGVIFVPGDYDEAAREFDGLEMAGIKIRTEANHVTADNRRFLVVHGDGFDGVVRYARWLHHSADWSYRVKLQCNRVLNHVQRVCGLPYWSPSGFLKHRVKKAVQFIADFENVPS